MIETPLLQIEDLHIDFETHAGVVQAVRGVSLELHKGEVLGVVGESGCGKTVTAQAILQLIAQPPGKIKQGRILFNGEDLLKFNRKQINGVRGRQIGMIFQDPMTSLNPTMSVGQQIAEGLVIHKQCNWTEASKQAIALLDRVGIPEPDQRAKSYPHQFSGGMRQRAMIAIALACRPKLLIADEPTTALDVTIQAQILRLLKELQAETGMAILLITHDLGVVAQICDRVAVLYAGQVAEQANVDQLFASPAHPYTEALLHSVPRLGMNSADRLKAIPGSPPDLRFPPEACAFTERCPYAMRICAQTPPSKHDVGSTHTAACWKLYPQEAR